MKGWKTWAGAGILGVSAFLRAAGFEEYAQIVQTVGTAVLGIGLGHKLEKSKR